MSDDSLVKVGLTKRLNTDERYYKLIMNAAGDSKDYAIDPQELRVMARQLSGLLGSLKGVGYVLGMAPGGIPITIAVSYESGVKALIAYKCRLQLSDEVMWDEPHATNSTMYSYGLSKGDSVVIVDDEIDSGRTVANAVSSLREAGIDVLDVGCAVESLHDGISQGRERLARLGLQLKSVRRFEVEPAVP